METKRISQSGPVNVRVTVPGSKSLTNRALLVAALTQGESVLTGALDSEDTQLMLNALSQLGLKVTHDKQTQTMTVLGQGGNFPNKSCELYIGNSGTSARFLTAALARSNGQYRLYGKPRMHERPIGDLIQTLNALGGNVRSETGNDCPPLLIQGQNMRGGTALIAANVSSQFLSALLMMGVGTGPTDSPLVLKIDGELVSRPYVEMTLAVLRSFGAELEVDDQFRTFSGFEKTHYSPREYAIEPDASAASYFFAIPALVGGKLTVCGLTRSSLQGDVHFVDCLEKMGCSVTFGNQEITVERPCNAAGIPQPLHGIDIDMNAISDTVQTLAVVALFATGPTTIRNVAHIRHKETDRISAVVTELRKLGGIVDEFPDGLTIQGQQLNQDGQINQGSQLKSAVISTYDDHRMAMSFSLAGLRIPGVEIENPGCTEKTYPGFFEDLARAIRTNG